jgi:hypothetical protein
MRAPLSFLFAMIVAGAAVSCGSPEGNLCNLKCDCEGCSDGAHRACLDDYDKDIKNANFRGCIEYYDDLITCEDATGVCDGTDWETSCHDERERLKNCNDGKD